MNYKLLSVIVPVYNEESTISEVIMRINENPLPIDKEIVVIDDGSNDSTKSILSEQPDIARLYLTPVNIGKGAAIRIGLTLVNGDIILIQDADLELAPEECGRLLTPILNGNAKVVYGSRFLNKSNQVPFLRRFANRFLTMTTNFLFGGNLTDMETAYKVFTREVAENIHLTANRFDIEPEITAKIRRAGYEILEVPISYSPRTKSEGKKIRWTDGFRALSMLFRCYFKNEEYNESSK
ncbi:MAG: glycosyltransferase family 2 protein [Pyrinomonadaceae bacterium]